MQTTLTDMQTLNLTLNCLIGAAETTKNSALRETYIEFLKKEPKAVLFVTSEDLAKELRVLHDLSSRQILSMENFTIGTDAVILLDSEVVISLCKTVASRVSRASQQLS